MEGDDDIFNKSFVRHLEDSNILEVKNQLQVEILKNEKMSQEMRQKEFELKKLLRKKDRENESLKSKFKSAGTTDIISGEKPFKVKLKQEPEAMVTPEKDQEFTKMLEEISPSFKGEQKEHQKIVLKNPFDLDKGTPTTTVKLQKNESSLIKLLKEEHVKTKNTLKSTNGKLLEKEKKITQLLKLNEEQTMLLESKSVEHDGVIDEKEILIQRLKKNNLDLNEKLSGLKKNLDIKNEELDQKKINTHKIIQEKEFNEMGTIHMKEELGKTITNLEEKLSSRDHEIKLKDIEIESFNSQMNSIGDYKSGLIDEIKMNEDHLKLAEDAHKEEMDKIKLQVRELEMEKEKVDIDVKEKSKLIKEQKGHMLSEKATLMLRHKREMEKNEKQKEIKEQYIMELESQINDQKKVHKLTLSEKKDCQGEIKYLQKLLVEVKEELRIKISDLDEEKLSIQKRLEEEQITKKEITRNLELRINDLIQNQKATGKISGGPIFNASPEIIKVYNEGQNKKATDDELPSLKDEIESESFVRPFAMEPQSEEAHSGKSSHLANSNGSPPQGGSVESMEEKQHELQKILELEDEIKSSKCQYEAKIRELQKQVRSAFCEVQSLRRSRMNREDLRSESDESLKKDSEEAKEEKDELKERIRHLEEECFGSKVEWAEENNYLRGEIERSTQMAIDAKMELAQLAMDKDQITLKLKYTLKKLKQQTVAIGDGGHNQLKPPIFDSGDLPIRKARTFNTEENQVSPTANKKKWKLFGKKKT